MRKNVRKKTKNARKYTWKDRLSDSARGGSSILLRMREPAALVVRELKKNADRGVIEECGVAEVKDEIS